MDSTKKQRKYFDRLSERKFLRQTKKKKKTPDVLTMTDSRSQRNWKMVFE